MSISEADMAGTTTLAMTPDVAQGAGWRDKAAIVAMIGSPIFNILALIVMSPIFIPVTRYFADHATNGVVFSVLGYAITPELGAQLMVTLLNIGIMFAGPLLGFLAERLGYFRLLPIALGIYTVAGGAGLVIDSPQGLLLSRLVLGLAAASISICCYSLVGERFKGADRARMLSYQSALIMATGLIGLFASGWVASAAGWRAPFAVYLFGLPMFLVALVAMRPTEDARQEKTASPGIRSLLPLWALYLTLIPFNIIAYMTTVHLPFVLATDGVADPKYQGPIMATSFLMNIMTSLLYGRIAAKFSRRWIFAAIVGIFATSDLIIGLGHGWVSLTLGTWVAGLAGGLMTPFFVNTILNRAPEAARATAIGLMYTMMYVGDFANPFVLTPLRHQIGNHEVFTLVGAVAAAVALLQALSRWTPLGPDVKQTT